MSHTSDRFDSIVLDQLAGVTGGRNDDRKNPTSGDDVRDPMPTRLTQGHSRALGAAVGAALRVAGSRPRPRTPRNVI